MNPRPAENPDPAALAPAPKQRSKAGRRIALAMIVLWLAVIVALYWVLVKLKLGGAEALRSPTPEQTAPQ